MSVREFAEYLGVSDRTVSKWEAGGERLNPRPDSQAMLDTVLGAAHEGVRARFWLLQDGQCRRDVVADSSAEEVVSTPVNADTLRHPTTGKVMVKIPGGPFQFGTLRESVNLPAFYIFVTPVTNLDYQRFISATGHPAPPHWHGNRCPDDLHDHPVVNVRHRDARSYCHWAGLQLPSEEQWEKAGRGEQGQLYPWGNQGTVAKCNARESGIGNTTPVQRYHSGVSPYGVYDMSGNVWEWCSTSTSGDRYVLKGGAFTSTFAMAAISATNDASEEMFDDDTGFRCVAPEEDLELFALSQN